MDATPEKKGSHKRAATDSPEPLISTTNMQGKKSKHRKRGSQVLEHADAIGSVAESIDRLAAAFNTPPSASAGDTATDTRRAAVKLLEEDGALSKEDQGSAMVLFRRVPDVADMYISISGKELRTIYIMSELT